MTQKKKEERKESNILVRFYPQGNGIDSVTETTNT